jgi:hypothetical protein
MQENRTPSRQVGFLLLAAGVVIALVAGLAEVAGVGGGTFGWKQAVGVAAGVVIALAGLYVVSRSSAGDSP